MDALMRLPPRARAALFVAVVAALAGLAVWASTSGPTTDRARGGSRTTEEVAVSTSASTPPAAAPSAAPDADASADGSTQSLDPAALTPLSDEDLTATAALSEEFMTRYASFRFDQDTEEHLAWLRSRTGEDSAVDLSALTPTGAAAEQVQAERMVTTATAHVAQALFVAPTTAMYEVEVETTTTTTDGQRTASVVYEVTVEKGSPRWAIANVTMLGGPDDADAH